ncbi:dihydropteroate synthase [Deinococcus yavapaiensis]|uniref:Dihydropteroate synthase n=1 Tax=Deinococcus yavapaiensis KR-236 TaxID=694435 RepID=A0A318S839_9DEIO|nr:dihydropteroate synthase [Deinococcus yavapaiensis]PYE51191.1 dihydropteroate synthase [Deinococcus yavapaiensis KR-236]
MSDASLAVHELRFGFPVPGAVPLDNGLYRLAWRGAAVMGILNVTPDSFSDGGRYTTVDDLLNAARRMLDAGALFLDVGGESTRPGAQPVSEDEEWRRVGPIIERLTREGRGVISVDTMKPGVARAALEVGAHLVNDVTGLRQPAMLRLCAERRAPAVVMHMRGEPRTMQREPRYDDVAAEVTAFLRRRAEAALQAGVPSVAVDPGLGFGKTVEHNLALLRALPELVSLGCPVLVGASRKKMIDVLANVPKASDRDPGSIALHLHAASSGAAIVRVHDVPSHVQALRVHEALHSRS